jgi:hypothetical protein
MISRCPLTIRRSQKGLRGWFRGMERHLKLPAHPAKPGRGTFRSNFQRRARKITSYEVGSLSKTFDSEGTASGVVGVEGGGADF